MKPKVPQQLFSNESVATPKHDEMLLLFSEESKLLKGIMNRLRPRKPTEVPQRHIHNTNDKYFCERFCCSYEKIESSSFHISKSDIVAVKWEPEKPINSGFNKYYIGSVDLYVTFKHYFIAQYKFFNADKEVFLQSPIWSRYSLICEFKPKIVSFSEVIRQVKLYNTHLKSNLVVVITYSDIDKYKKVFESQNILLVKLSKDNKIEDLSH